MAPVVLDSVSAAAGKAWQSVTHACRPTLHGGKRWINENPTRAAGRRDEAAFACTASPTWGVRLSSRTHSTADRGGCVALASLTVRFFNLPNRLASYGCTATGKRQAIEPETDRRLTAVSRGFCDQVR